MDRIVAAFDGSSTSAVALRWAVAEAGLHGARLTVHTVLDHPHGVSGEAGGESVEPPAEIRRAAAEITEAPATEVTEAPATEHGFSHGSPAAELIRASSDADLLVLGTRGHSVATDLVLGSVSRACLHAAEIPVAIVPAGWAPEPSHHVVAVGVDASPHARRALAVAAVESRLRGADLYAIHAVHWDRVGHGMVAPAPKELLAWGREVLDAELGEAGVPARPLVIHGRPSEVLVRYSKTADLLVVGSRGRNPLANLLLGSTSAHCAHHTHSPIIVTR